MGALNLPSAADIERLTRRLRSVSLRLEGIEEGVDRLDRTRTSSGAEGPEIAERLSAIEDQLKRLTDRLDSEPKPQGEAKATKLGVTATKRGEKSKTGGAGPKASGAGPGRA
jgi:chromosome segregation ATPase